MNQEIVFRGTREQCEDWMKSRNMRFGDESGYYLSTLCGYWLITHEWHYEPENLDRYL